MSKILICDTGDLPRARLFYQSLSFQTAADLILIGLDVTKWKTLVELCKWSDKILLCKERYWEYLPTGFDNQVVVATCPPFQGDTNLWVEKHLEELGI